MLQYNLLMHISISLLRLTRFSPDKLSPLNPNLKYFSSYSNLENLLLNMPREYKHTAELKKHRQKLKEKGAKYVPGTVTLQVLGSGARGAPRSLYIFTDQSRYLFNCGEGVQRLAHEHKMKLSKLEHIFITSACWENIGGLPGVALTIQDVGVPEVTLHGPKGTDEIFSATRRFVILRDLSIRMAKCTSNEDFEDNVMTVQYVPLYTNSTFNSKSETNFSNNTSFVDSDVDHSDDEIDYYAHERSKKSRNNEERKKKDRSKSEMRENVLIHKETIPMCMSYVCRLKDRPGILNLSACVERGVPPGPLLGQLKNGEDVLLENGTVVRSCDVTTPDEPGPVFIVVECPTEEYLDSLLKEPIFHRHQSDATCQTDTAYLVVHFTPPDIVRHPKYKQWMERFCSRTTHLLINEENMCMGSIAVHRIQYKLNLLEPNIFPLLNDNGIPIVEESNDNPDKEKLSKENALVPLIKGRTFYNIHLRPRTGSDASNLLYLSPDTYVNETYMTEGFEEELTKLRAEIENYKIDPKEEYPKVLFLGTGSCIPNKTRNTSGILIETHEKEYILLDSGESTYGQIVRFFGREKVDEVLVNLKAIYISHLHADHHIGLIGVLKGRERAMKNFLNDKMDDSSDWNVPLYLLAPKQIMSWLKLYHRQFEPILSQFVLIPNSDLQNFTGNWIEKLFSHLNMSEVKTAAVRHCPNAFGISFTHNTGWKLTYSGDTLPCQPLIDLGMNSDVLIHEATMEDELEHEARCKLHSTTSQAITVGQEMKAKFILLTHFSQRYAKLPRLNDSFTNNIGIAFDNMQVSLNQLPLLPKMYPALKLMFAEHCEELEVKAQKRLRREERKRAASNSPDRSVKVSV